ncbi:MAG: glutamyl-tRNA reductase [Myxococcaceae bacterium]
MELLCVGVSHKSAPVDLREKLALTETRQSEVLARLSDGMEVMLVSTCNRVEWYGVSQDPAAARQQILDVLVALGGPEVLTHLYEHRGDAAAQHLFRVSASLDSMVIGEPQILGQVKDAFELAQKAGSVRGELSRTAAAAFSCAKRVRTETGIGRAAISMASAAVQLAEKIFGGLEHATVLVVGAGEMSELAARHLKSAGSGKLIITNRTLAKAEALAAEVGATARPFEGLDALLTQVDIVVSATGSTRPIFTQRNVAPAMKARRHRPLFLVDLAVPRDIDPEVHRLDGVYAYDVDDIQKVVAENEAARAAEAARAERLIAEELARFVKARTVRNSVPVLAQLRAYAQEIAKAEVEKTLTRMTTLDEKQRKSIEAMGMAIVNKLLHAPTMRLRNVAQQEDGVRLADAAAELFGLTESEQAQDEQADGQQGAPAARAAAGGQTQ